MSFDLIDLVLQAGLIVKLVLLVLVGFSAVSWALIGLKWRELRNADQDSEAFLEVYHRESFGSVYDAACHLGGSPLALVFLAIGNELRTTPKRGSAGGNDGNRALDSEQHRSLERIATWAAADQAQRLERGLPFLATTGSSAPFIGLFGTVIGIIKAFQMIGEVGNASLATVGPGIAEALIATAVGLFAAIPATIAYNAFAGHIDNLVQSIDRFTGEFIEDLSRMSHAGEVSPIARAAGTRTD